MPVKSPRDTGRALKLALNCSVAMKSLSVVAETGYIYMYL